MGAHSRRKGAAAEREVVTLAQTLGFPRARRYAPMQAAQGGADECADVENVGRLRIEVKRRGKGSLYALAVDACRERPGQIPTLAYREDRGPWLAVVPLEELIKLENEALRAHVTHRATLLSVSDTDLAAHSDPEPRLPGEEIEP